MANTPFHPLACRLTALALMACGMSGAEAGRATPIAPFKDTIAQRALACTACHGLQGRAAPDGYYPRLAGKPAGYLYNQLLNFRDGRRRYSFMAQPIEPLGDAYLLEIAQYFSRLEVPYRAPLPARSSPEVLHQGERLVMQGDRARQVPACTQCHGKAMTGVEPHIPGLVGLPRDYLNAQLGAWKTGQRRTLAPDCMKDEVARLTLEDINAVASWVAAQPLPPSTRPALAPPALAPGADPIECARPPSTTPLQVPLKE